MDVCVYKQIEVIVIIVILYYPKNMRWSMLNAIDI